MECALRPRESITVTCQTCGKGIIVPVEWRRTTAHFYLASVREHIAEHEDGQYE